MDIETSHKPVKEHQRRLLSAQVNGVLGEFDHRFEFEKEEKFAIVYGPNGVGKTRVLEIINSLCNLNIVRLLALPFRTAELAFSDGARLRVERKIEPTEEDSLDLEGASFHPEKASELNFYLFGTDQKVHHSCVDGLSDFQDYVQKVSPYEPTDDVETWIDPIDGELVSFEFLRRRHQARFKMRNPRGGIKQQESFTVTPKIQDFADSLDVRLIETQRLISQSDKQSSRNGERLITRDKNPRNTSTIIRYSEQIKQSLDNNLSENSRLTQRLDSTFPRRMLERGDKWRLSEEELREKWASQTTRRARLTEIAYLNVDPELSLPKGDLNSWQLGMLELYLEDADEKLGSFSNVLSRIDLLEEIINARLLRKNLRIDANDGLVVTRDLDKSRVPLTALSSGEQHEIILMFDLLFNVPHGSIVMIDEPEISLHIGWQKKFISDVLRISTVVGFQFVVATHSPQIIDRWWKNATRLGPTSNDFHGNEEIEQNA